MSEETVLQPVVRFSASIGALSEALAAAQKNYTVIVKDKKNPHTGSKYADLQGIVAATQPSLAAEGIVVIQAPMVRGRTAGTLSRLSHKSGEFVENELLLPTSMPGKEDKFDAQSIGSAITYSKRYSYAGLTGAVAEDDDDGNAAAGRENSSQSEQSRRSNPKPAPQVNQAPAKTGGPRPGESKSNAAEPVKPPANAQGSPQTNEKPVEPTGTLPYPDTQPDTNTPQAVPTPTESTTSMVSEPAKVADNSPKPDKSAFDKYVARAITLKQPLEKAGLKPGKGFPTGEKLKRHILASAGVQVLTDLTVAQWESWFEKMEKLDPAQAVALIEGEK